jgi:hypothetical protein
MEPWMRTSRTRTGPMLDKPQQQTLSVRISETLRRRLDRAKRLRAAKLGEPVSTSQIAKQLLESACDGRMEVVDLLAAPTDTLLRIRRKGDAQHVLSRAEWTVLAHFVRHGLEASSNITLNPVSRESIVGILDAFLAVYELRTDSGSGLDAQYLGNLPADCHAAKSKRAARADRPTGDIVRRTVMETRRAVNDPSITRAPLLIGRNLYLVLDEEKLPGAEDVNRALRPFWSVLWRLAARGHYIATQAPVRERETQREGLYQPPIHSLTEGTVTLSFARTEGPEFAVLVDFPGPHGPRYPITSYPRIAEFRSMLAALVGDGPRSSWSGPYFLGYIQKATAEQAAAVWFRAQDNGITIGVSAKEWKRVQALFLRGWDMPDIREAWNSLAVEYGEL